METGYGILPPQLAKMGTFMSKIKYILRFRFPPLPNSLEFWILFFFSSSKLSTKKGENIFKILWVYRVSE